MELTELTTIELKIKHIRKAIVEHKKEHQRFIVTQIKDNTSIQDIERYNMSFNKLIEYENELLENNWTFKALKDYLKKETSTHKYVNLKLLKELKEVEN